MLKKFVNISLFICLFILCSVLRSNAQYSDSLFHFQRLFPGDFSFFTSDNLNNLYLLNRSNQLIKYDEKGDSLAAFNDVKSHGRLQQIDATNPLKLLLFYKNFSTIVTLDRFLNARNTINLKLSDIFSAGIIASSYDNNIWVFDEGDSKLKKIDDNGKLLTESIDCRNAIGENFAPTEMTDRDGLVYLYDPLKGFFIFDHYGLLTHKLPFLGWHDIFVSGQNLYGFSDSCLYAYPEHSLDLRQIPLPTVLKKAKMIRKENEHVYLLNREGLTDYIMQRTEKQRTGNRTE